MSLVKSPFNKVRRRFLTKIERQLICQHQKSNAFDTVCMNKIRCSSQFSPLRRRACNLQKSVTVSQYQPFNITKSIQVQQKCKLLRFRHHSLSSFGGFDAGPVNEEVGRFAVLRGKTYPRRSRVRERNVRFLELSSSQEVLPGNGKQVSLRIQLSGWRWLGLSVQRRISANRGLKWSSYSWTSENDHVQIYRQSVVKKTLGRTTYLTQSTSWAAMPLRRLWPEVQMRFMPHLAGVASSEQQKGCRSFSGGMALLPSVIGSATTAPSTKSLLTNRYA